jgi:hypothetical protein
VRRFKTSARRLFLRRKLFDAAFYLERYPDLAAANVHPFAHYLLHGAAEGRKPNPWLDPLRPAAGSISTAAIPLSTFSNKARRNTPVRILYVAD